MHEFRTLQCNGSSVWCCSCRAVQPAIVLAWLHGLYCKPGKCEGAHIRAPAIHRRLCCMGCLAAWAILDQRSAHMEGDTHTHTHVVPAIHSCVHSFVCRYKLPIIVIVMNNGGIYGGDRRERPLIEAAAQGAARAGFGSDPPPTAFVDTRCDCYSATSAAVCSGVV